MVPRFVLVAIMVMAALISPSTSLARGIYCDEHSPLLGLNADWSSNDLTGWNDRLGVTPGAYSTYIPFPITDETATGLDDFVQDVSSVGGTAIIRVEPMVPLSDIDDSAISAMTQMMAGYNHQGVPVLLVFAPEMNGSWNVWGQQPDAYVEAFRKIADAIHGAAPDTEMVWAPNYGGGYPFRDDANPSVVEDFPMLDTNGDSVVNGDDDPYAPFYPGDEYVDWSGLTLFHWGNSFMWGENEAPEPGKFVNQLRGEYKGANGDESNLPDFYGTYVEMTGKPFLVLTSAMYNEDTSDGDAQVDIKRQWWRQVFGEQEALPGMRVVEWFEQRRESPEVGDAMVDWSLTHDDAVRQAFVADLPELRVADATCATSVGVAWPTYRFRED